MVAYDETNGEILTTDLELIPDASNPTRYSASFFVPDGVTQVRWGAQVVVENVGAILVVDDIELTQDPFVYKDMVVSGSYRITQNGSSLSNRAGETQFNLGTASIVEEDDFSSLFDVVDDSGNTRTQ